MKKLLVLLGISSVLSVACGNEKNPRNEVAADLEETEEIIKEETKEETKEENKSSQELEDNELISRPSARQKREIIKVAGELDDAVADFQSSYVEELHAIVMLINDDVMLNEYLRAIDGQQAYLDVFQSMGNTVEETSRKIVRDSGVNDLALILAASLEDNNGAIIFKFENGTRLMDVFEDLGYY